MNTYLVVAEHHAGKWVYAVKVVGPDWRPKLVAFYSGAKAAHAEADRLIREFRRIIWVVCILPGIADIGIIGNRHHHAAFVVADTTPVRADSGRAIFIPRAQVRLSGNLDLVIDVVHVVEQIDVQESVEATTKTQESNRALGLHVGATRH